jgi:hypothetical protein
MKPGSPTRLKAPITNSVQLSRKMHGEAGAFRRGLIEEEATTVSVDDHLMGSRSVQKLDYIGDC